MMMALLWFISSAALLVALVAWRRARRATKRLEQLTQMYWELKYQHGELRVRLQHQDPGRSAVEEPAHPAPGPAARSSHGEVDAFIPLTALKR
jgi:hypothetical protein